MGKDAPDYFIMRENHAKLNRIRSEIQVLNFDKYNK